MNEYDIYEKIKCFPQTRYTLADNKTDLVKVNRHINELLRKNLIIKKYYHIDETRQVVYIPIDFKGFLINYAIKTTIFNNTPRELLIYFKDYKYELFSLKIKDTYVLQDNEWVGYGDMFIDKSEVRCF